MNRQELKQIALKIVTEAIAPLREGRPPRADVGVGDGPMRVGSNQDQLIGRGDRLYRSLEDRLVQLKNYWDQNTEYLSDKTIESMISNPDSELARVFNDIKHVNDVLEQLDTVLPLVKADRMDPRNRAMLNNILNKEKPEYKTKKFAQDNKLALDYGEQLLQSLVKAKEDGHGDSEDFEEIYGFDSPKMELEKYRKAGPSEKLKKVDDLLMSKYGSSKKDLETITRAIDTGKISEDEWREILKRGPEDIAKAADYLKTR